MIKDATSFYNTLLEQFPFTPTSTQDQLLKQLSHFVFNTNKQQLFLLKG
jgi:exodeoxyribonuclease-5